MTTTTYRDLLDVLPKDVSMENYCGENGSYGLWERDVATPALERLGYTVIRWRDGERDSFGPLSRIVLVERDGEFHRFVYG